MVKKSHMKLLADYIASGRPNSEGELSMLCPLHEDENPSASLNVENSMWYCNACEEGGSLDALLARRDEWLEPGAKMNGRVDLGSGPAPPEPLPTAEAVSEWHERLMADPERLAEITEARHISAATLARFNIGWNGRSYSIPVYDGAGTLVNIRFYSLHGRVKIWGVTGHNEARLYPYPSGEGDLIVCEGEWDAIATAERGFDTVTRTGSARTWTTAWSPVFAGRRVYLAHDCDETGQAANRKVARALAGVASEVLVVRLPYPILEKHGKDLTDYWLDGYSPEDFRALLDAAQPFERAAASDQEAASAAPIRLRDMFDGKWSDKTVKMTVTIGGRRQESYTVPKSARLTCSQDAGQRCQVCPLNGAGGDDRLEIAPDSPAVLEMVDAGKAGLLEALRTAYGAIKCTKMTASVEERQSVEVLLVRPSMDSDERDDPYRMGRVLAVGVRSEPNVTVDIIGHPRPEPRSQLTLFQAHDIRPVQTSIDNFKLGADDVRSLKMFRPDGNQAPLKKLVEIGADLSHNVTGIVGRPALHAAMDLVWHSALMFDFDGRRNMRGWLDVLIIGDTRTGKSEVARRLAEHYRSGEVVSCEAARFTGIVGGQQQFGGREWAMTWGVIPLNDRRLVALDEVSGLSPDQISQMSDMRSSGRAELIKILQERTFARTRLLWLGNPREGSMSQYTYGIAAIPGLIGRDEDIARFDLALSAAKGDVSSEQINRWRPRERPSYPSDECAMLVRWAWSRTADQVVWADGAEDAVRRAALDLGRRYVESPPLIQAADVRNKVARIATALASRLFSSDHSGETVQVRRAHVKSAVRLIDSFYGAPGFGYRQESRRALDALEEAKRNRPDINDMLRRNLPLAKLLRDRSSLRRQDLEEALDMDNSIANATLNQLWEARMLNKEAASFNVQPVLREILRGIDV